jgi:metal-dependent amidase/aminoacylase/carboxypeptidase family protein
MKTAHLQEAMLGWRHDFHLHPELEFKEHQTAENIATLLEEFGIQGLNLKTGMEFGFAKLFSKASKIIRLLAAGIFLFDENIFQASPNYLWLSQPHHFTG